jgi:hypothetical protein
MFSIKMLQKYQNLKVLDNGNSIITVPITIDNQVWGALNIEKIPFIKYNLYTEQLLLMIADLAAPIIRNAIRYSTLVHKEVDPVTGFNSISEFYEVISNYSAPLGKKYLLSKRPCNAVKTFSLCFFTVAM